MGKITAAITGVGQYLPEYILTNDELSRMVAQLDHLGGRYDSDPLGGTSLRSEHGLNFLFVAEQHDTAVRPDRIERHDGSLDSRFGCIIAAHGIYANLYHTRTSVG